MANNRMWLKNKRTNAQILIAKYYPSTGWCPFHDDLRDKLEKLFDDNKSQPTVRGDNDWFIEYEAEDQK
jgi:hypothetical protein